MKITIEATAEIFEAPINGTKVPVRVWTGQTEGGIGIEAYVLSIVPKEPLDHARMASELPGCMRPSSQMFTIDTRSDTEKRAQHIHETGLEPT